MKTHPLTKEDKELIGEAMKLINYRKLKNGDVGDVACALRTQKGQIFTGVCLDLPSGIGFCAEHSAISDMVSHSKEFSIDAIVAMYRDGSVMYPCGRCRELMRLIEKDNMKNTWVITGERTKVKLKYLLPGK